MPVRQIPAVLMLAVLGCSLSPALLAQSSWKRKMPDRLACKTVKDLLPKAQFLENRPLDGIQFTSTGITLTPKKKAAVDFTYRDTEYAANETSNLLCIHMLVDKKKKSCLFFDAPTWQESAAVVSTLAQALTQLMIDAHEGHPYTCTDNPGEQQKVELAAFEQKTAAWRVLATKPPTSDEVYKNRLLAEDAFKNKDLVGAVNYYEAGVAADPTWYQGWYNAALVYSELKDYWEAADCMKHYVILVPDAPDAQAAKDNIILWEAKAETGEPATATPTPSPKKKSPKKK